MLSTSNTQEHAACVLLFCLADGLFNVGTYHGWEQVQRMGVPADSEGPIFSWFLGIMATRPR
jgi:hypothetical protein